MPGRDGVPHMLVSTSTSLLVSTDRLWHPGTSCWLLFLFIARGANTHRQQRDLERCLRLPSSATMTFRPTRLMLSTANIARCVPPPPPISHLPSPSTPYSSLPAAGPLHRLCLPCHALSLSCPFVQLCCSCFFLLSRPVFRWDMYRTLLRRSFVTCWIHQASPCNWRPNGYDPLLWSRYRS